MANKECDSLKALLKEFKSTLKEEKDNLSEGHRLTGGSGWQDQDNLEGWIEGLEYATSQVKSRMKLRKCK